MYKLLCPLIVINVVPRSDTDGGRSIVARYRVQHVLKNTSRLTAIHVRNDPDVLDGEYVAQCASKLHAKIDR